MREPKAKSKSHKTETNYSYLYSGGLSDCVSTDMLCVCSLIWQNRGMGRVVREREGETDGGLDKGNTLSILNFMFGIIPSLLL